MRRSSPTTVCPAATSWGRLARRALWSGSGVNAAVQALAASGRSPRAFSRRELAFTGPVAVLWGEKDALVNPSHAEALKRALSQAHIEIVPGMGHHPQRERPAELEAFIERHAAVASRGDAREGADDSATRPVAA